MPAKVLVADDSVRIQRELSELLQAQGVEVVTVSNGEHAVRQLPTAQPDLVLADLFMPVRTGYEVCEYIKTNEQFAHIPVLLLASRMEPYDEAEARRVRADGKVEKPFVDTGAVLATIQSHLEKAAAQKPAAPIEEFAAAVPAETEPEPEPEPEPFPAGPPPVRFEDQAAPMGFSDMEEAPERARAAPVEAAPTESAEVVDPNEATILTTTDDLKQRTEERNGPVPAEAEPAGEVPETEEAEEVSSATAAGSEPEPAPAAEETTIEKPELAEAWEMTGPEPGAPEIPARGGWESAWKGEEEAATSTPAAPAEEEEKVEEAAEAGDAAAAEEVSAPVAEQERAERFAPEEFARAFGGPATPPATEEDEEAPPAEVAEESPTAPAPETEVAEETPAAEAEVAKEKPAAAGVDPAVIDEVVSQVLERLSPQVMDTIAREIVRPLAENLLREKLNDND
ncbi:MAG: PleD family two-component system response regulator [Terriglobia bacterium]